MKKIIITTILFAFAFTSFCSCNKKNNDGGYVNRSIEQPSIASKPLEPVSQVIGEPDTPPPTPQNPGPQRQISAGGFKPPPPKYADTETQTEKILSEDMLDNILFEISIIANKVMAMRDFSEKVFKEDDCNEYIKELRLSEIERDYLFYLTACKRLNDVIADGQVYQEDKLKNVAIGVLLKFAFTRLAELQYYVQLIKKVDTQNALDLAKDAFEQYNDFVKYNAQGHAIAREKYRDSGGRFNDLVTFENYFNRPPA
jgi:hypothetical protein